MSDEIEVISGDPDAFFDELRRWEPDKKRYTNRDEWRDFQAVFCGQSTEAQGRRVLWTILGWGRLFRTSLPGDNLDRLEGRREVALKLFALVNATEARPEMPAEKEKNPHERL